MENNYPQFIKGQKVVDCYGQTHIVLTQTGCSVLVYGGKRFHPKKIWAV